jgi:hypothetical protein
LFPALNHLEIDFDLEAPPILFQLLPALGESLVFLRLHLCPSIPRESLSEQLTTVGLTSTHLESFIATSSDMTLYSKGYLSPLLQCKRLKRVEVELYSEQTPWNFSFFVTDEEFLRWLEVGKI